jgi:hypothetical protein
MLNQFAIPTRLIVGVPSLILLGILVWFAIVWWRARRGEEAVVICISVCAVDDDLPAFGDSFEDDEWEQARAEHERAMHRIAAMRRPAQSAGMKGQNWREN